MHWTTCGATKRGGKKWFGLNLEDCGIIDFWIFFGLQAGCKLENLINWVNVGLLIIRGAVTARPLGRSELGDPPRGAQCG